MAGAPCSGGTQMPQLWELRKDMQDLDSPSHWSFSFTDAQIYLGEVDPHDTTYLTDHTSWGGLRRTRDPDLCA